MDKNKSKNPINYENKEIKPIKVDFDKKLKQNKIVIQNIEIFFPYQPYESQITYMTKGIIVIFISY